MEVGLGLGSVRCPSVPAGPNPIGKLTTTGLKARVLVSVTLRGAAATAAGQVCFRAPFPFTSKSSSTSGPRGGTGFLFACSRVKNQPPCVVSTSKVGTGVMVVFAAPGRSGSSFGVQWPGSRE